MLFRSYLVDGSHNSKTTDTTTALTNESMDAATTKGTALTALKNRNGESLNIHSTDSVTVSYVHQGQTYTTTVQVGSLNLETLLQKTAYNGGNKLENALSIKDASNGKAVVGIDGSGNTIFESGLTRAEPKIVTVLWYLQRIS